ncbi:hypothetical protein OAV21_03500 [bacterium]|jgi:hypothetical protein|nr:hypothetical protein [bacterium]MDC3255437.1 hypothetical protein [bacterium]
MISLTDPVWNDLSCNCVSGREFADILASYYGGRVPDGDELYEDLSECICGGDVYDSSYAAVPHLVRLAQQCSADSAATMLSFAAHALAEWASGSSDVEDRLAVHLSAARSGASIIAERIFADADDGHFDKGYFHAALLAFQGDSKGYREAIIAMEEKEKTTKAPVVRHSSPGPTWSQSDPTSRTSNSSA